MKILLTLILACFSTQAWAAAGTIFSNITRTNTLVGTNLFLTSTPVAGGTRTIYFSDLKTAIATDLGMAYGDASMLTNKEPKALRSFYAPVGLSLNQTTNSIKIAWIGDSWSGNWLAPLKMKMKEQYGFAGDGFWGIGTNGLYFQYTQNTSDTLGAGSSLVGTWTTISTGSSPNMGESTTFDLSATCSVTSRVTRFVIWYKVQTGGGTFTYSQDGGAPVSVPTAGSSGLFSTVSTPGLAYGLHTLDLAITSAGTDGVTIAGINYQNESYGVRVHDLSRGGTSAASWAAANSNIWTSAIATLNPDIVFLSLGGVGDRDSTLTTYSNNYSIITARLKTALPNATIVHVSQAEHAFTNSPVKISDSIQAQRAIAAYWHDGFVDNYELFGANSVSTAMGLWVDALHPSATGTIALYTRLANYIHDGGVSFGGFTIFPRFNAAADNTRIVISGDADKFWIRGSGSGGGRPIQIGNTYPSLVTNMTFQTDGFTTVKGFTGNIGIGVAVGNPIAMLDVRGTFRASGNIGTDTQLAGFTALDAEANDAILTVTANNSVTGNFRTVSGQGSATGIIYNEVRNTAASGGAMNLMWSGTGGDAWSRYSSLTEWSAGEDYSDGGKYKISNGQAPGTADAMTIDTNKFVTFLGPVWDLAALGANTSLFTIQATDAATGDTMLNITGNAVTGSLVGVNASHSATVTYYNQTRNTGAGSALNLIWAGTTGDAYQRYSVTGADWATGADTSDATKFKIGFTTSNTILGTGDRVTLTTNGNMTVSGSLAIGGGAAMLKVLTATGVLDFPSTLTATDSDLTIAVTGAALGDVVNVGVPNGSTLAGGSYSAWVSSADTVTVRFSNYSASSKDPASGTFRVQVNQF